MIRSYQQDDLAWLMETANKAWRPINAAYRRAYGDELFELLVANEHTRKGEEMRDLCREQPGSLFVCEENGGRAGFIHLAFDRDRKIGIIGNNAVDPDRGLKGIGQQMYRFALELFRREGMRFAHVQTGLDEGHAAARRAYERAGFDISHSQINYYTRLAP
jgi:GNAT superfamily N-acetyltransferase